MLGAFVVMLGSAASPNPAPAGSGGALPSGYRDSWWIVVAMAVVLLIIAAGTFYLQRTHRIDLSQLIDKDEEFRREQHRLEALHHEHEHDHELEHHQEPTDHRV